MRLLIIHHEAEYFAGAERMLGYFLQGLATCPEHAVTVAAAKESKVREIIPPGVNACWVPPNSKFSMVAYMRQTLAIRRFCRVQSFDLVHGWAARDWELTALIGKVTGRPAIGTLHDHPKARFISRARQRLMRLSASGLQRVVCVSEAVRQACLQTGYNERKLTVVRNGLPPASLPRPNREPKRAFRLGYLGVFSERKGLRTLFQILDDLARLTSRPWEVALAGDAQEEEGRRLVQDLRDTYSGREWWPRVQWRGWVKDPGEFMATIDVLVCPSSDFDPFPTVVLEAGQAGVPVLGARVGGIPEMIEEGTTGWLFDGRDLVRAARKLEQILGCPALAAEAGRQAKKRVEGEFAMKRMVEEYLKVYTDLSEV